ncbi:MAG: winged helix DNA-binding domain-containing protein [Myxococcaceae bacterium]
MKAVEIARRRLAAQRLSGARFERPEQVVAWLGAVQAQDYLGALWAIGVRTEASVEADVERALEERRIVRTWPMRGTLHFVAPADARWMTELLAPKMVERAAKRIRDLGLDAKQFARAGQVLSRALEGGKRLERAEAYETLKRAGVSPAGQRGIHILWTLAQDCLICFGPRAGKQQTFVLFDEWLPKAGSRPRDEALAELARRYFTSHGPATVADFAWWSGLKLSDAREAVESVRRELEVVELEAGTMYFVQSKLFDEATFALPAFDEFLVAYTDRSAALDVAHKLLVNDGGGILNPTVVVDARVVGTWKRTLTSKAVRVKTKFFAKAVAEKKTRPAFERYAGFLQKTLS